ncbi:hypothetical protein CEE34_07465 [Candidatus Aerophobetes bacterium Ae_b3a]|nr:MAG: hypothetical protein CEE34_07465 [Candidatus Aerophobetes bacterium Ae_b3a]
MSGVNDSETGRFGRRSEARGEKKSHLRHQIRISYLVARISQTKYKTVLKNKRDLKPSVK